MHTIAVVGSGELGATVARRLAEGQRARRVVMVDLDLGRAQGKALDITQSGPLEGFDVRVEGASQLEAVGAVQALVVADPADLEAAGDMGAAPARLVALVSTLAASVPVVVAGSHPSALVEAVAERRRGRDHVVGSAPVAAAAALRRQVADQLGLEPREVSATVLGTPPHDLLAPLGSVTVGGIAVERLSPTALRRARAALAGRAPGPVALAAAAVRVLAALDGPRPSVLPVVVRLEGEYGLRGRAVAVPAHLAGGRVQSVVEVPLEPVDRVALEAALERRRAAPAP